MANEETIMPANAWPGNKSLAIESVFSDGSTSEIPFSSIGRSEDWEVLLPSTSDRVCSEYENHVFPMYEVVFKDMGFRLPFSDFQREVFRRTKLSPSQIRPNSYAFLWAFELVCKYPKVPAFKMFSLPFSPFSVETTGFLSAKPKRYSRSLRAKCGASKSVSS